MSDNRLKQAVIGVGGLGSKHVFRFQVLENAEVVAVCDVNAKRAEKVARANRTRHWFPD